MKKFCLLNSLKGNPLFLNGTVDMGYDFQLKITISNLFIKLH